MKKNAAVKPLTEKQQLFVVEYVKDLNATQAAIRAGYSAKGADVAGIRALGDARIAAAVQGEQQRQLQAAQAVTDAKVSVVRRDGEAVKERLFLLGFQDIRKLFDVHGNLRPIHELEDDVAPMIAGMEVIIKNAEAGDGVTDRVHKVKVVDPVKPLEMLAKHFGLLVERVEVEAKVEYHWKDTE